jgi:hypothetical protein
MRHRFFSIMPARHASVWWLDWSTSVCSTVRSACFLSACWALSVGRSRPANGEVELVRGGPYDNPDILPWVLRVGGLEGCLARGSKMAVAVEFAFTAGSANMRSPMKMTGWPPTTSIRAAELLLDCVWEDMMLSGATRRVDGLKMLSGRREVPSSGRSLGTTLPPAVTRMPGGLPCSLRSFSALPRLMDGVGEGLFCDAAAASDCATGGRRLLPEDLLARLADADAEGRRTCSAEGV